MFATVTRHIVLAALALALAGCAPRTSHVRWVADVRWADDVIERLIPADLDSPAPTVSRVTLGGRVVFEGRSVHA